MVAAGGDPAAIWADGTDTHILLRTQDHRRVGRAVPVQDPRAVVAGREALASAVWVCSRNGVASGFVSACGSTAVAITPGWLRSEMMLDNFQVKEDNWRDALDPSRGEKGLPAAPPIFALSESPRFVGRAVADWNFGGHDFLLAVAEISHRAKSDRFGVLGIRCPGSRFRT